MPTSVVLLYHRMGLPKLGSLVAGQYVCPRLLGWQLDYLTARGWRAVSLEDMLRPADSDRFAVTFDDGYASVYRHAVPVLKQRSVGATVYVVAGCIGGINEWDHRAGDQREDMVSAEQVIELSASGFEIGSHTLTHRRLTELSDEELASELTDSKRVLEDLIGKPVTAFSYPYGACDRRVLEAARAAGYTNAVTTTLGVMTSLVEPFEIPRVNVRWNAIGPLLARKILRARRASGLTA